ncbi:MAG TPA: hypothetical protein VME70_00670 [Mycobacteriales bacterium]|nr:hypothetical protein [Mycobacteriales bacterium]
MFWALLFSFWIAAASWGFDWATDWSAFASADAVVDTTVHPLGAVIEIPREFTTVDPLA